MNSNLNLDPESFETVVNAFARSILSDPKALPKIKLEADQGNREAQLVWALTEQSRLRSEGKGDSSDPAIFSWVESALMSISASTSHEQKRGILRHCILIAGQDFCKAIQSCAMKRQIQNN
jgi:hypothetical protein